MHIGSYLWTLFTGLGQVTSKVYWITCELYEDIINDHSALSTTAVML